MGRVGVQARGLMWKAARFRVNSRSSFDLPNAALLSHRLTNTANSILLDLFKLFLEVLIDSTCYTACQRKLFQTAYTLANCK